jgi:drug/metabolite transporter (DMT)-like permease
MKKPNLLVVLCYLTLYVVWGSTYFAIKAAVQTIPPFYVMGARFTLGGILLLAIAYFTGRITAPLTRREIAASLLLGTLLLIAGNGLVTLAETEVDSYLVALLLASTPMVVAFYDRILLGKRISAVRLSGISLGIVGVAFLVYNGQSLRNSLTPEILMVIGALACWGLATSLGHKLHTYRDPLVNSAIQMIYAGILCLAGSVWLGASPAAVLSAISPGSGLGVLYLATIGSLAFGAYTYLIAHEPAIRVSSYALINPVIATLLGLIVGGESPVPFLAVGLPLILVGVTLMLYGEKLLSDLQRAGSRFRERGIHDRA